MTTIEIKAENNRFILKSYGHTDHDCCVAISALINALIQYAKQYKQKNFCYLSDDTYMYGQTSLSAEFINEKVYKRFMRGIDGIVTGFKLYSNNFPESIKFIN